MALNSRIKHLTSHGAYLHKRTTSEHLTLVSVKDDISEQPQELVAEAFAAENYPHLLHLLREGDEVLRKRVLIAMTEVFRLPQVMVMCLRLGLLELIESNILDKDREVQEAAAQALCTIANSVCGCPAILKGRTVRRIAPVLSEATNIKAACFLYDALLSISKRIMGAQELSSNGYLDIAIAHLKRQSAGKSLRLRALKLLKQTLNDGADMTVLRALELNSVDLVGKLLHSTDWELRAAACNVIATLCYLDKARHIVVGAGYVQVLCGLLTDRWWQVTAASVGALMVVAMDDEAKLAIVAAHGLDCVNHLLESSRDLVKLNTLKMIATVAALPGARKILSALETVYLLEGLSDGNDELLAKSASKALKVVQWKP